MSTYANWQLGSCAMHGQSCQIVIEDTVAQFAHTECQYTKYWHASAFELVWYHATKYAVVCYQFLALPLLVAGHLQIGLSLMVTLSLYKGKYHDASLYMLQWKYNCESG